jgi:hypothetical protein
MRSSRCRSRISRPTDPPRGQSLAMAPGRPLRLPVAAEGVCRHDRGAMFLSAAKIILVALLVLEGIPAETLWSLTDTSVHAAGAPHRSGVASCKLEFVLGMQGPCDPGGPCRNPHHGHHGHQHPAKEAIPCPLGPQGRPDGAVLAASPGVPVAACDSPLPAAPADRPWIACLPAPCAERAPPVVTTLV